MIEFTKYTGLEIEIMEKINELAKGNIYFNTIMYYINNNKDILINIGTEDELLKDSYNKTGTLTQYRGYNVENRINLFYTRYENIDSLIHSLLHEFCHYIFSQNALTINLMHILNGGILKEKGIIDDFKTDYLTMPNYEQLTTKDEIHEDLIEEKICDYFATTIIGKDYNRQWWRENIKKVDNANDM